MSNDAPCALVTGASTGIGAACVERLEGLGWRVLAGVRSAADAARAEALSPRVEALRLDVTDSDQIRAGVARSAEVAATGLRALVHCAGTAIFGPIEFLPPASLRAQLEVNVVGAMAVTQSLLPQLRTGAGRVVFLGSVSGRVAPPFLAGYCTSKFALEALADCLRRELLEEGIEVSLIEAGRTDTPIWSKALAAFEDLVAGVPASGRARYAQIFEALSSGARAGGGMAPGRVADVVVEALTARRPKTRYVVGADARRRLRLGRLPDRLQDRLLSGRVLNRQRRRSKGSQPR